VPKGGLCEINLEKGKREMYFSTINWRQEGTGGGGGGGDLVGSMGKAGRIENHEDGKRGGKPDGESPYLYPTGLEGS